MTTTTLSLKGRWDNLKTDNPNIRSRQAADKLGVSEADLLASTCNGENCIRLREPWKEIIESLESLGYVMALTRNEAAVHEKKGTYQNVKLGNQVGLVLDKDIDLRIFFDHWHFGFAAEVDNPGGTLYSLQFFDRDGTAVHKIYMMNDEHHEAYRRLVERFAHPDQSPGITVETLPEDDPECEDNEVDRATLLQSWSELKDTHGFHLMLKRFNVKRTRALRMAENEFTYQVDPACSHKMLRLASGREMPVIRSSL